VSRTAIAACFLGILSFTGSLRAQTIVLGKLLNNYSYISPGLPNYGIAQGSIFRILGTNLAESTASQGVPLQTTFSGVTVAVTVSGVTTQAIPYFVSTGQINAVLPSRTPVGNGTITVSWGGQTSQPFPIQVVESAFGLSTVLGSVGSGTAVAQDSNQGGELLSQTNAANPGEYLTLWGSGLGPVSGDETQYQTQTNLTGIPIKVDIGGVSATVAYSGRSIYPGLDQIDVIVPAGVSGCNVSVVVTANGVPSNVATIPVATSGGICSDPELVPVTPDEYQNLLSLGNVNVGTISLTTLTTTTPQSGAVTSDTAYATFQKYTALQSASTSFLQQASVGSCLMAYVDGGATLTEQGVVVEQPSLMDLMEWRPGGALNAGPQINVNGPDGSLTLLLASGNYVEPAGTSPTIIPSTGGAYTFDNFSGGPDIGGFATSLSVSLTAPLVWTNISAITAIKRANGQLVTWIGGIPGSFVDIYGYSYIVQNDTHLAEPLALYAYFTCSAPASAGQFTVPAAVLNSLPQSTGGYLYVANEMSQRFSAPGLDLGLLFFGTGSGISVPFN
jgi:uncharacterized protein (TIGR03437 family)